MAATAASQVPSLLEIEVQRLKNALQHLTASNQELQQVMQQDRAAGRAVDPDLKQAFDENIVTIAKQKARLEAMEKELQQAAAVHHISAGTGGSGSQSAHPAAGAGGPDYAQGQQGPNSLQLPAVQPAAAPNSMAIDGATPVLAGHAAGAGPGVVQQAQQGTAQDATAMETDTGTTEGTWL